MARPVEEIRSELVWLRCRRGQADAWDELVAQFSDRLLYFIRRLVENEHDACNLLQDVWLKVVRNQGSLKDPARLRPWLYSIAHHTAMSHLRRDYANARNTPLERNCDVSETPGASEDDGLLDNAELVHFGLSKLGLAEREVLTLFFLEGFSVQETSRALQIPPGTVKSRMFKARQELRRILKKELKGHAGSS